MNWVAISGFLEPVGMAITSPPTKLDWLPSAMPGSGAMPKSISGWLAFSAAMAKPPEPCMPMVPVSNVAWKFARYRLRRFPE